MKVIMVTYDSLNTRFLPNYGCDWVKAPNFERFGRMAVTFDHCYCGSMPCMPARRELHTGRYNFLHRCWGPIEPYDDSMPEILSKNGYHAHLVSDHGHYWEDGGCTGPPPPLSRADVSGAVLSRTGALAGAWPERDERAAGGSRRCCIPAD